MNKISESIWNGKNLLIPMADVQHIENHYHSCDLADGTKKGDFRGIMVITKHTTWDMVADIWSNSIWISNPEAEKFIKDFCYYRYEFEGGEKAFKRQEAPQNLAGG